MKKLISSAAILTGVLLFSQVQAAEQDVEARLEAIEKKLEGTSGGNFIKAGKNKIDVTLYGQVNKAVMLADDGEDDDVFFVDNDASSTRFGIKAKSKSWNNLSAGAQFEAEYQGNDSNKVSMTDTTSSGAFSKRQMKVWLKHKQAGRLTLGHGSTATDGISEIDLSGTKLAGYSKIALSGGGFEFWNNTAKDYTDKVGDVFNHLDGGRTGMVRYDSPELAGLTLSAASGEENFSDIALTYRKKLTPLEIQAGLGYAYEGADDFEEQNLRNRLSGSASVLFDFGLNLTVAAGNAEFDDDPTTTADRDDASFNYVKVGYKFKAFDMGSTAVSVDYGMFDDFAAEGDEGTVYGLQIVQKADAINTEFYLGFRNMELDRDRDSVTLANVDLKDIQTTMAGARFKF